MRHFNLSSGDWFSLLTLIAGNLYPIAGVYLFGWAAFPILFLYWAENVVIGVFVVLRMVTRLVLCKDWQGFVLTPFFIVHYGIFCFVHGAMLMAVFGSRSDFLPRDLMRDGPLPPPFLEVSDAIPGFWLSLAVLAFVHFVGFVVYYMLPRDYLRTDMKSLMSAPYSRILVLHFTLILAAGLVLAFNQPAMGVVMLVVIKTVGEVLAFLKERA